MSQLGLYIHFPFCRQKCHYCSLFSQTGLESLIPAYLSALQQDVRSYQLSLANQEIDTIYLGGGTPSLLEAESLGQLLNLIKNLVKVSTNAEISIEANPETLTLAKLSQYRELGINRLSLGLQAWQDHLLARMGRRANRQHFLQALSWAKQAGFTNINVDLIFGLPGQTLADWQTSLEAVIEMDTPHLACYSLEVDDRSTWGRLAAQGKFATITEELDREMASLAKFKLAAAGLNQYEISNFARPGFRCRHNFNFWHGQEYVGLGAGAHSYFQNYRYHNVDSIPRYIQQMTAGAFNRQEKTWETEQLARENFMAQRLRLNEGISLIDFENRFGTQLTNAFQFSLPKLLAKGLIKVDRNRLGLTKLGRDLENQVMIELMS